MLESANLTFESGESSLSVREVDIDEPINGLFVARVVALSPDEDIPLSRLVGRRASLDLIATSQRKWEGLCIDFRQITPEGTADGFSTYELTIVPKLWLLSQRIGNRHFQHVTQVAIVERLLDEWAIEREWRIDNSRYSPVELRVQYGESDYDFIRRMLEEMGISYFFEFGKGVSKLILHDAPQTAELRERGPIRFSDDSFQAQRSGFDWIKKLSVVERSRPGKVTLRDYDPTRPDYRLFSGAGAGPDFEQGYEQYRHLPSVALREMAGGAAELNQLMSGSIGGHSAVDATPVADDRGVARFDQGHGDRRAQVILEGLRADKRQVTFQTNALDLGPGRILAVAGHPRSDLKVNDLLLSTHLKIQAKVASTEMWLIEVTAAFAEEPFRPKVATPKPRISGMQSAVVVGPSSPKAAALDGIEWNPEDDIYVDEHGRVRVQFHWDREGRFNGGSSIWMRVSQGWAGGGYGMFTIPRVGHEVLVSFLDGDPDCPIIVGTVHNARSKLPYGLPKHKTVSTIKSESSPGGGGFNELRFDDAAGREHLYLQAQKDMASLVKNDQRASVGNNRTRFVQNDESINVGHDRTKLVKQNEMHLTGLNHGTVVGLTRSSTVGVEDSTIVGTRWSVTMARGLTSRLNRQLSDALDGGLSQVMRGAASGILGLVPNSPLSGDLRDKVEAALDNFGASAKTTLRRILTSVDGFAGDGGPPPTAIEMVDRQIKLSTGEASIVLDGPNITLQAQGNIVFHAMNNMSVLSEGELALGARDKAALVATTGDLILQAGKDCHLNPYTAGSPPPPARKLRQGEPGTVEEQLPRCDHCGQPMVETEDGLVCHEIAGGPTFEAIEKPNFDEPLDAAEGEQEVTSDES